MTSCSEIELGNSTLNFERLRIVWIAFASSILLISISCGKSSQPQASPPDVEVIQVEQKDVPIMKEWIGTLDGLVKVRSRSTCLLPMCGQPVRDRQRLRAFTDTAVLARALDKG